MSTARMVCISLSQEEKTVRFFSILHAGAIFKKHNYIRNYKKCKKGAIAGLITTAAIIVLFGLMLIISIL